MLSTIVRSSVCNDASERKLKYADGAAYLNSKNTDMHPAHTTKLSAEENLFLSCWLKVSVTKPAPEALLWLAVS